MEVMAAQQIFIAVIRECFFALLTLGGLMGDPETLIFGAIRIGKNHSWVKFGCCWGSGNFEFIQG
jgi:hypothetical protein